MTIGSFKQYIDQLIYTYNKCCYLFKVNVLHILDALIGFKSIIYIYLMHEFQEREKRGENLDELQEINPNKVKMAGSPSSALPWQPR